MPALCGLAHHKRKEEEMNKTSLYVLAWRYFDGSGGGVWAVYDSDGHAKGDKERLEEVANDKEWKIYEVPFEQTAIQEANYPDEIPF